ncbi:NADP-dependent 3-hydroxy acid dehydrogenase YdfG [Tistlia consotensis]|uniref:NADP-dependent 3-hydroxy acid dehydrogenase YdfG n=1 Tax=Tistlia consotensis USBA 355 TaxID=560819 RepID=A0A1Y6B694_9PROT|nr:SDR family oxidoreductase [Tistlia consotensis]SME90098.1 NADP-dependent 3-hydroxy acid dehydrogenase YdfG [Tistlia consotensis USBA 355]SNR26540.1 NADP-dependent 3-hydroxy acid dehydrogenase YdfG [Tistlia consotensis]
MDLGLAGRSALITGASQGIGEGLAETFAEEGVNLHLTARRAEPMEALAARLRERHGVTVSVHPMDLTEEGAIEGLVEAVGDVDILVNNAGVIPGGDLQTIDQQAWRDGWELKVFGYIALCRLYYARMKAAGGGVIVNNIGNAGERYDAQYIAGTTGNASLMAFTRALGGPSLDDNIRVVGINPGPVDTDRIYKLLKRRALDWFGDESRYEELLDRYPLKRPAHVREITDTIAFLASDRAGYITGTIVTVDGGIASRSSII